MFTNMQAADEVDHRAFFPANPFGAKVSRCLVHQSFDSQKRSIINLHQSQRVSMNIAAIEITITMKNEYKLAKNISSGSPCPR
jgi:hypothetical protein